RESVETLLREHAFRHSPFRALIGADLSPHDHQALANAAALGRIPCGNDFLLMASQAALSASQSWKLPHNTGPQPVFPNTSINNLNLAELSSMMASNPAMASLYFSNIPRNFMSPSFPVLSTPPTSSAPPSQSPQQHPALNSPPGNGPQTQPNMSGIGSPYIPTSMAQMSPLGPGFPTSMANSAATASALYASRLQLNHLYQNLKFHPYLQTNRFMPQMVPNSNGMLSTGAGSGGGVMPNGKLEPLDLNSRDSPNGSVPSQM
ncbi:unnamed protein product, partial [Oppiella nova]